MRSVSSEPGARPSAVAASVTRSPITRPPSSRPLSIGSSCAHSSAAHSAISAVAGRARCSRSIAAHSALPSACDEVTIATTSGLPLLSTMPHTPSAETPRKWCALAESSMALRTHASELAGALSPTGIDSPLTSSRSVALCAETAAQASRSQKNCGVIVSPNSSAVGSPSRLTWSSSSRASLICALICAPVMPSDGTAEESVVSPWR
mmetsp:Transcript_42871/g.106708  ORF Transcript_42871/g.106708 Transcript_42871/m.106708 type:complete len:207 (-) Transcript_42871:312-932(-)